MPVDFQRARSPRPLRAPLQPALSGVYTRKAAKLPQHTSSQACFPCH